MVVAFYFRLHLAYFPRPVVAIFARPEHWKTTTLTRLWKGLYILLGTILLVIPGLIMGYTYAMTDYILAEHPDMAPGEVMKTSKAMMEGNR